jgi:hypothetical protein
MTQKDTFGTIVNYMILVWLISSWVILFVVLPAFVIYGKFFA